ncbi:MAG: hypothetical protein ACLUKN_07230 [Bacilli bacterium]
MKKACVVVLQDGPQFHIGNVISNLLAKGEIPMMIAVASSPNSCWRQRQRFAPSNRTLEYDTPSPRFQVCCVRVVAVCRDIKNKRRPQDNSFEKRQCRMIAGFSSLATAFGLGAHGSFESLYRSVFHTGLRGSFANATLVHKYEPKPQNIYAKRVAGYVDLLRGLVERKPVYGEGVGLRI